MIAWVSDRIADAKKIQESCGCKEKGLSVHKGGGSYICMHYNFATVFPEFIEFWQSDEDPSKVAPRSSKKFKMGCKARCGADPYLIDPANYAVNIGCDGCTGKGRTTNLIESRTVAGNKDMLKLWSPNNIEDPATVPSNSNSPMYLWQCPKDPDHEWPTTTAKITDGHGCTICWNNGMYTIEQIKIKFAEVHGSKYTYDWTTYKYAMQNMDIICAEHGKFSQTPANHYSGRGCRKCSPRKAFEFSLVLEKFREAWGDLYEYDEDSYISSIDYMTIICSVHGPFQKTPSSHTQKGFPSGCQKCSREKRDSAGVRYISRMFTLMSIDFLREEYFDNLRSDKNRVLYFDFLLKSYRLITEYDGEQHFKIVKCWSGLEGLLRRQASDLAKDKYAIENGYSMVRIPYWANEHDVICMICSAVRSAMEGKLVYLSYKNYQDQVKSPNHYRAYWINP